MYGIGEIANRASLVSARVPFVSATRKRQLSEGVSGIVQG